MAGVCKTPTKIQIQKIVENFSNADEEEDEIHTALDVLSQSVNAKSLESMKQSQLQQLTNEISHLEKQIHDTQRRRLKRVKKKSIPKETKTLQAVQKEIEDIENQIEYLAEVTGVNINDYSLQRETTDEAVLSYHEFTGTSRSVDFVLKYVTQKYLETGITRVMELEISIEDTVFMDGLEKPLQKLSMAEPRDRNCSLHGFFRLIIEYSSWVDHRAVTFNHFHSKYPDVAKIQLQKHDIPTLIIQNPALKHSPILTVTWGFNVDLKLYRPTPNIQLQVEISKSLLNKDEEEVMSNTPHKFQEMLRIMGIEQAIETVILLLSEK